MGHKPVPPPPINDEPPGYISREQMHDVVVYAHRAERRHVLAALREVTPLSMEERDYQERVLERLEQLGGPGQEATQ